MSHLPFVVQLTTVVAGTSAHATCLGGAWYNFTPSFTCNENVPLEHSIPEKHCCSHYAFPLLS